MVESRLIIPVKIPFIELFGVQPGVVSLLSTPLRYSCPFRALLRDLETWLIELDSALGVCTSVHDGVSTLFAAIVVSALPMARTVCDKRGG